MKIQKKFVFIGIFIIFIFLVGTTALAANWSELFVMGYGGGEWDTYPSAASDNTGNIHVVWTTYPWSRRLYYNKFNGTNWLTPQRIDSGLANNFNAYVATDDFGNAHVVWNGGPYRLQYKVYDGNSWSSPFDTGMYGIGSVVVSGEGEVFVASFRDGKVNLRRKTETWGPIEYYSWEMIGQSSKYFDFSKDSSGKVYISYTHSDGAPVYRIWEDDSWTDEYMLNGSCASPAKLFHGPNGIKDIICSSEGKYKHFHFDGLNWNGPIEVSSIATPSAWGSVNSGPDGTIIITWYKPMEEDGGKEDIFAIIWDGNKWLEEENVSTTMWRSIWSASAISSDLKAFVIWSENEFHQFPWKLNSRWKEISINSPPSAAISGPDNVNEGLSALFDASGSMDTDGEIILYEWDLDNDGEYDDATGMITEITWWDNGEYPVGLRVTDEYGESDIDQKIVTVNNIAPNIIEIVGPSEPILVNGLMEMDASFEDPGADEWFAEWNWGDGSSSSGAITDFLISGSHTYETAGVYSVELTINDDDGGFDTKAYQYVVVYDPDGGFVTGGGWVDSPGGAYTPDPTLTGKATFGFVSKYKKGATVPTGNTEFQFKAGDLNFHSSDYQWLVVTGSDYARFKGTGTINGEGEYKFMIWAGDSIDEGADTFRIRIWEEDEFGNETDVYDNGFDQAIGGGNIVVHTGK